MLVPLFLAQCATYYRIFKKESEYFTAREKVILEKTTDAIGFGSGFDPDLKIDYVFSHSTVKGKAEKKKPLMEKALAGFKSEEVTAFYEKMFRMKLIIEYKMEDARKDEDWNEYTHMKKYILPSYRIYFEMLEESVATAVPGYTKTRDKRKALIRAEVKKEFE